MCVCERVCERARGTAGAARPLPSAAATATAAACARCCPLPAARRTAACARRGPEPPRGHQRRPARAPPAAPAGRARSARVGPASLRVLPHRATSPTGAPLMAAASNRARRGGWPPPPRCPLTPFQEAWKPTPGFPLGGGSRASARDSTRWRFGEVGLVCAKTRSGFFCQS